MKNLAEIIVKLTNSDISRIKYSDKIDPQAGQKKEISLIKSGKELGYVPKFTLKDGLKGLLIHRN